MVENPKTGTVKESFQPVLASMRERGERLGEEARVFVRRQVDLWRLIPGLAVEATRFDSRDDHYAYACVEKAYPIRVGRATVCIDLESGDLFKGEDLRRKAEDRDKVPASTLLAIVAEALESLDAVFIIERMIEDIEAHSGEDLTHREEGYRTRMYEDWDLQKPNLLEVQEAIARFKSGSLNYKN